MTRRQFVSRGLKTGAGALLLPAFGPLFGSVARAAAGDSPEADPRFFLLITLPYASGLDSSYLFDARPLEMTQNKLIQNYRKTGEPTPWVGSNGVTTLATELTAPLVPFKPYFSVLNGVVMAANFDGHDQNTNYLYTGDAFGGESFVPHLNLSIPGRRPLDAIQRGRVKAILSNTSGTVPLTPPAAANLVSSLRAVPPLDPGASLFRHLRERFALNAAASGSFALGAAGMQSAFEGAPELARMLSGLQISGDDDEPSFIRMLGQFFRAGAAKGAILVLSGDDANYDTHDATSASAQPRTYAALAEQLASVLRALRETPFDSTRSLMDVTTFMFCAEFGRTLRQGGKPVDATGTDHNPLSNMVLVGGKGIRGGQVIGASDFAASTETLSPAHLSMDPERLKAMSRPFDFTRSVSRTDLPAAYKASDYLGFNSVINTIYDRFGVDTKHLRLIERNGAIAPVIRGLML